MKKLIVLSVLGVIAFFFVTYLVVWVLPFKLVPIERMQNESRCRAEKLALDAEVFGTVSRKFRDTNHHFYETVELINSTGKIATTILVNETSGVYDSLQVGDIVSKSAHTLEFSVVRDSLKLLYNLDYGCKRH